MERLRTIEIYRDARLVLFTVESVAFNYDKTGSNYQAYGCKKPVAVVVCRGTETFALDMTASIIPIKQLSEEVPYLAALIGGEQ